MTSIDTLYVSWNTGSISGIVNIAIKLRTASEIENAAVVDGSSTDIRFRYDNCLFHGNVTIIVEVFDNCQRNFASEPYYISLTTTDELPSSTFVGAINNYSSLSTSRISTHQPSAVIYTSSPTLTSTPSSDTSQKIVVGGVLSNVLILIFTFTVVTWCYAC
ncbi:hypothetical protein GBAR_LOCUS13915 [Geodia barretti]|nr:hypothetical protein GBAR_LOCUS13915 [Geodia barretti]